GQEVRSGYPARSSVGLGIRHDLQPGLTFNADYRFTDLTRTYATNRAAGVTNRLDLSLTTAIADGRGELQFGVEDAFNRTQDPVFGVANFTSHPTPGRAFFVRLQWKF
ncbi:MAG: hypothetical protein K2X91_05530, partial [Thermoleophilia bacterium]|nr:hypothetical protein [Thermoleophilia bacterium]